VVKCDEMPSTSKLEPKLSIVGESVSKCSDVLTQKTKSVKMVDKSTDSRYSCRPIESKSKVEENPSVAPTSDLGAVPTPIVQKIWTYICLNCCERHETKKQFLTHFEDNHMNRDLAKKYKKADTSVTKSLRRHRIFLVNGKPFPKLKSTSLPSSSAPTHRPSNSSKSQKFVYKGSKARHKSQKHKKVNAISNAMPSGRPSDQMVDSNHYRVVQKCKICSFTPLIDSMKTIKKHIRKEHKQSDPHPYYSDTLVKIAPRNAL